MKQAIGETWDDWSYVCNACGQESAVVYRREHRDVQAGKITTTESVGITESEMDRMIASLNHAASCPHRKETN
jgi:hypothetical protein